MRAALAAVLLLLAAPAGAAAEPQLVKVGDFANPVGLAAPPGDGSRMFVVQRGGVIRLVKAGVPLDAPFADLSGAVSQSGGEEGLLGMAFPPDYAASGLAYVFLVSPDGGELQIRELQRSADPDRASPGAGRLVLAVTHAQAGNHNGGQLAFGPDGMLYAATGDGGAANDPEDDAADTGSLLGKLLRIDPRATAGRPYTVPADNPFANEVWALGLRNPWRFSFDRASGDLVIGDVGQGVKEEIDWAPAATGGGRGADFGWRCWEGTIRTPGDPSDRSSPPLCGAAPAPQPNPPTLELDHGGPDNFCAVVGGFVVRDPGVPSLAGRYLFGDNCRADLLSVVLGGGAAPAATGLSVTRLTSFGEDACGRVYTAAIDGDVRRLQEGAPTPCAPAPPPPAPGAAPGPADTRAPALRLRAAKRLRRGRLKLTLRADEAATATLRARRFRARSVELRAGATRVVRLKATAKGLRKLRRALRRGRRPLVTVRVGLRDAAGNTRVRRVRVRLRR